MARAPGWTPETLYEAWGSCLAPRRAIVRASENPAATITWLHAACRWVDNRGDPGWIEPWIARILSAGSLPGWSSAPGASKPVIDAFRRTEHDQVRAIALLETFLAETDLTDDRLAEIFDLGREWLGHRVFTRHSPEMDLFTRLFQHPAAGPALLTRWPRAARSNGAGQARFWWEELAQIRPEWCTTPSLRWDIDAIAPSSGSPAEQFFFTYASADAIATNWARHARNDLQAALAHLGTLPARAIACVPLSAHDLQQCLLYAPSSETRLGIIAALRDLPMTTDTVPPTALVVHAKYADIPAPVIPDTLAAHHPLVRDWLASFDPELAAFVKREGERDAALADKQRAEDDERTRRRRHEEQRRARIRYNQRAQGRR